MSLDPSGRRRLLGGLFAICALAPAGALAARRKAAQHAPHHAAGRHAASHHAVKHAAAAHHRKPHAAAQARAPLPLIVIDPGHGGQDPGAIGASGTPEKAVTLAAALELKHQLEASRRYRVLLTRSGDDSVELAERVAIARRSGATLLISLHADASPLHGARGASVYIRSGNSSLRRVRPRPREIARALAEDDATRLSASGRLRRVILESLSDDIDLTAAPAREAHLYVLGSGIPSVLLEMGFISNRKDEAALRSPKHRRVIAAAVRDAVDAYFARLRQSPGRRT